MAYTPPGVELANKTKGATITLLSTQRLPIYIGKGSEYKTVINESIVRSSTGLVDALAHTSTGVHQILRVGSQAYLDDYIEGVDYNLVDNKIYWTSTGSRPVSGATYYVSYKYNRPDSDYLVYKTFSDINDVFDDIGPQTSDNPLSMVAYIALKILGIPTIGIVQVKPPYSAIDFQDAIDKTKEIDHLVSIYPLTTDFQVQVYAKQHVKERSLPQNKRERMFFTGAPTDYLPGDKDQPNTVAGLSVALKDERVVVVSPTRVKYTFRNTETGLTETVTVDGAFYGACIGSYKDSLADPSAPILRHDISFMNLSLYEEDRDVFFSEYNMNKMAEAGVLVTFPKGNQIIIRDDITSDTSDIRKNNINIVEADHYIVRTVRDRLDETFIGQKILNKEAFAQQVVDYLIRIFTEFQRDSIISDFDPSDFLANVDLEHPDTVNIRYEYTPVYTDKHIIGTYALKL